MEAWGSRAGGDEEDEPEGNEVDEADEADEEDEYNLRMFGISRALPVPEGAPDFAAGGQPSCMHARIDADADTACMRNA